MSQQGDLRTNVLPRPATVERNHVRWTYATGVLGMHALAMLACLPWLFHWASVAAALAGVYVFGTLGINLCYHRLLTHRGYQCPRWLEHGLATLGVCALQDTPARWVAVHRLHHQHSDEQPDPHSPLAGFFWGHMEWLLVENRELKGLALYERYAKDLLNDRFYRKLERGLNWLWINLAQWAVFFLAGSVVGWGTSGRLSTGVQFGLSLLVWGVFVRTVLVWHITWSVNSVTHRWGYRTYETDEGSRNNFLIGILSNGEGWHNNHHAQPRAASHGHLWWELDVTYLTLRVLAFVGLAWDIVLPDTRPAGTDADSHGSRRHRSSGHKPWSRGLRPARRSTLRDSETDRPNS
ncbi:MAG: Fatty acid desaturase Delta-9 fatty acid desaturase [Planctomycetota bacterium]|nr:Fatty acid desaturase Delta-9 fatty acid desaturase [Planctomycetota bacterium]